MSPWACGLNALATTILMLYSSAKSFVSPLFSGPLSTESLSGTPYLAKMTSSKNFDTCAELFSVSAWASTYPDM
jgi:hypothetical protein